MTFTRSIAMAVIVASLGVGGLQAQNGQIQPAEFPSSAYKGKQYVDSGGCVFIRAGIDGNVTWIPRMSRARKPVCGFKPTGVASAAAQPATAAAPVQITLNTAPATQTPVAKPAPRKVVQQAAKPAPVVVRQTAAKPAAKPVRRVAKPVVVAAAKPAPVVAAPVATKPVKSVKTVTRKRVVTACPGASALSQQYLRGDGRMAVRCGPQSEPIVASRVAPVAPARADAPSPYRTAAVSSNAPVAAPPTHRRAVAPEVTATTRIVPKHVAIARQNTTNVSVPKGYRKVWQDGRLNPNRAEQNLGGRHEMLLIWTQSVPRRLINQATGRDVTASVPLIYPYLDITTQKRELGEVTIVQRDGKLMKRVIRHANAAPIQRAPVYSSRSTPKAATPAPAAPRAVTGARFVQVGLYGNPGNAQRAANTIARMGMPARIGKLTQGGKTYHSVQAGPFGQAGAVQSAVSKLRGAGYKDAFARK